MPIKAPFRFARINRRIYEPAWADLVSHDVPFADGLSGEAVVEITARSSILVGGDRRKATAGQAGEVRPFKLPDGDYVIPGSALQGMARSILEVAGFGRLGPWVADRKFGIRDLSGTPTARAHYQDRLSKKDGNHVTINSRAGWLMKSDDGSPCILPCKYARIHLDDVLAFKQELLRSPNPPPKGVLYRSSDARCRYKWFMKGLAGNMAALNAHFEIDKPNSYRHNRGTITITYSKCRYATGGGGTLGTLVLTGKPQDGMGGGRKKLEFVFHCPDRDGAKTAGTVGALPVSADVWMHSGCCMRSNSGGTPIPTGTSGGPSTTIETRSRCFSGKIAAGSRPSVPPSRSRRHTRNRHGIYSAIAMRGTSNQSRG